MDRTVQPRLAAGTSDARRADGPSGVLNTVEAETETSGVQPRQGMGTSGVLCTGDPSGVPNTVEADRGAADARCANGPSGVLDTAEAATHVDRRPPILEAPCHLIALGWP